jgi:hypothetical protein
LILFLSAGISKNVSKMAKPIYISVLSKYIITDIAKIVLSYINKHQLYHVTIIPLDYCTNESDRDVNIITSNDNAYVWYFDNIIHKIIENTIDPYEFPDYIFPIKMLEKDTVLVIDKDVTLGIYNIANWQFIKKIPYPANVIAGNERYIFFSGYPYFRIYDFKNNNKIGKFDQTFQASNESEIIGNIVYLVNRNYPIIHKYLLSGKHIGDIELKKIIRSECTIKIRRDEIVVAQNKKILFYDLEGSALATTQINEKMGKANDGWVTQFSVTSKYVYIVDSKKKMHIYKRIR